MKKIKTLFWVFNGLFGLFMLGTAIPDILSLPEAVNGMHGTFGYPLYFIPFIGIAKVLGVLTILLPVFSLIKEWAYAGFCFDLVDATFSIIASGQTANAWFMIIPISFGITAYYFFRRKQLLNFQIKGGAHKVACDGLKSFRHESVAVTAC